MRIKINKKIYMMILSIIIFLSLMTLSGGIGVLKVSAASVTLSNPKKVSDSSMESGQKVTYDCIWFGNYPQSEITPSDFFYYTLENSIGWDSNNEIIINNKKYRRIKKKDAVFAFDGDPFDIQGNYEWSDETTWHYFLYEPIKWRVLEVNNQKVLLVSDLALDTQIYNNIDYVDQTWDISTMRSWLNGYDLTNNVGKDDFSNKNFIDSAFPESNQKLIDETQIHLSNSFQGTEKIITDKIFLLSDNIVCGNESEKYGFANNRLIEDEAKKCKGSNYAHAMGAAMYNELCDWWVLSKNDSPGYADKSGNFDNNNIFWGNYNCVRPALNLNLVLDTSYAYAGTVCSDGSINEISAPSYITSFTNETNKANQNTNGVKVPSVTEKQEIKKEKYSSNAQNSIPKTGIIKTVKSPKKKAVKITWKKINGITGYQIYISQKKNFLRKTIERKYKKQKSGITIEGLKSKKKYYIKLRPYKKVGKTIYFGNWSKTKSVKIK